MEKFGTGKISAYRYIVLNLSEDTMDDKIKKPEKPEQAAESSARLSEQELENSGEAPLPEEELNKVAGGLVKPIGGKPTKYM